MSCKRRAMTKTCVKQTLTFDETILLWNFVDTISASLVISQTQENANLISMNGRYRVSQKKFRRLEAMEYKVHDRYSKLKGKSKLSNWALLLVSPTNRMLLIG